MVKKKKNKKRELWQRKKNSKSWVRVYALVDETGHPFYVGQTRKQIKERLKDHLDKLEKLILSGGKASPAYKKMKECKHIDIRLIEGKGIVDITEAVWINRLSDKGYKLYNVTNYIPDKHLPWLKEKES